MKNTTLKTGWAENRGLKMLKPNISKNLYIQ